MGKLGRNAPCHCGSGKKYKKCCLQKDQERQRAKREQDQPKASDPGNLGMNLQPDHGPKENHGHEMVRTDPDEAAEADAKKGSKFKKRAVSDAQDAIITAWWKKYSEISDPEELHAHIEDFLTLHPDLVEHAELNTEPLFELEAKYFRQDRYQPYIDLLVRLRRDFPKAYAQGFAYYNISMISWLIMNDRRSEIGPYLEDFRDNPVNRAENLFELIDFLSTWNCQDILTDFVPHIFEEVCTSNKIFGGGDILYPMLIIIMAPFLDQGPQRCDPQEMAKALEATLSGFVKPKWFDPDFLAKRIELILGRHECWNLDKCKNKKSAIVRYDEMTANFMGWLTVNQGLDWCAAEFHARLLFEYLAEALQDEKKMRNSFPFSRDTMDTLLAKLTKKLLWLDSTQFFGMLNGVYWFADFLKDTHSMLPEQSAVVQQTCRELFEEVYDNQCDIAFMTRAWARFPRGVKPSPFIG